MAINYITAFLSGLIVLSAVRMFRMNKLSTRVFFIWLTIWIGIGFFSLFPSLLDTFMDLVSMKGRAIFLSVSAIVLICVILFYITADISRMESKISKLTREIAILNYKLDNALTHKPENGKNRKPRT